MIMLKYVVDVGVNVHVFTSRVGPNVGLTAALHTNISSFPNFVRVCKSREYQSIIQT